MLKRKGHVWSALSRFLETGPLAPSVGLGLWSRSSVVLCEVSPLLSLYTLHPLPFLHFRSHITSLVATQLLRKPYRIPACLPL